MKKEQLAIQWDMAMYHSSIVMGKEIDSNYHFITLMQLISGDWDRPIETCSANLILHAQMLGISSCVKKPANASRQAIVRPVSAGELPSTASTAVAFNISIVNGSLFFTETPRSVCTNRDLVSDGRPAM